MCVENKIAYYCENNNMTIAELAQKLKVKERAVLQWEKGVKIPDIDEMRKLSEILNVSIEELFVIEDVKTNAAEKDCYDSIFQKYDYERIWKFKRSTIIASSLFCIAVLLAVITLFVALLNPFPDVVPYTQYFTTLTVLVGLIIATVCTSVVIEVVSALSLKFFYKTKYYQHLYKTSLRRNLIAYLSVCFASLLLFLIVLVTMLLI